MMRKPRAALWGPALALMVLAGCNNGPVGAGFAAMSQPPAFGEYQRQLRAREAQRNIPYSIPPEAPLPVTGAVSAGPAPSAAPAPPPVASATTPAAAPPPAGPAAARPQGVSDSTTYTPIPFGQRPAGAEIPPQGTTQIVPVAAVPTGTTSGPNVVAFALQTRHPVGSVQFTRRNPLRNVRWESRCLAFVNQDAAQEAFLAAGGPEADRQNLDPDGDGYACWWDPAVYRQAATVGQ